MKLCQDADHLITPQHRVKLTIASKIGNGQSPCELQLVIMRWYPGQNPLEDTTLSPLKQLLHGLIYNTRQDRLLYNDIEWVTERRPVELDE